MSARHWTAAARKGKAPIRLFVTTTDDAVAADMKLPPRNSLMEFGRAMTLRARSEDQHFYLAAGAFETHAHRRGITDIGNPEPVDQVPEGLTGTPLGGRHKALFLAVSEGPATV